MRRFENPENLRFPEEWLLREQAQLWGIRQNRQAAQKTRGRALWDKLVKLALDDAEVLVKTKCCGAHDVHGRIKKILSSLNGLPSATFALNAQKSTNASVFEQISTAETWDMGKRLYGAGKGIPKAVLYSRSRGSSDPSRAPYCL